MRQLHPGTLTLPRHHKGRLQKCSLRKAQPIKAINKSKQDKEVLPQDRKELGST